MTIALWHTYHTLYLTLYSLSRLYVFRNAITVIASKRKKVMYVSNIHVTVKM